MNSLTVNKEDIMKIEFYEAKNAEGTVMYISSKKEELSNSKDVAQETIKKHEVIFRKPNFKDNTNILSKAIKVESGNIVVDPVMLKYVRFVTLLKDWDLIDDDGMPMSPNSTSVDKLDSDVANLIMDQLEKII